MKNHRAFKRPKDGPLTKEESMKKQFVVVRFLENGKFKIWPDYGEVWGSPLYEVLDYFDSHKVAQEFIRTKKGEHNEK